MARKPRFNLPGVPQHVIQRGNNREPCFFDAEDYRCYLDALEHASKQCGCAVHAYILITNHVHLLVTQERRDGVSAMMQSLGRRYVRYINDRYQRTGTLWEGRYKAALVDSERYLLACYRYIELNPVRAGMVKSPGRYPWSSYRYNALGMPDSLVIEHGNYQALGSSRTERCDAYRKLFRDLVDNEMIDAIRRSINEELVLGSDNFKDRIETMSQRRTRLGKAGRPRGMVH